jgi:hypothetical protein
MSDTISNLDKIAKKKVYIRYFFKNWLWNIFFNFFINFIFPFINMWISFLEDYSDPVPVFGEMSVTLDIFWMCVYLGFLLPWFVTQGTYEDVIKRKKIPKPNFDRESLPILKHLPSNSGLRGLLFAGVCIGVFLPLELFIVWLFHIESIPFIKYTLFKGLYGAFMAFMIEPIVRFAALCDKKYLSGKIPVDLFGLIFWDLQITRATKYLKKKMVKKT